MLLFIILIFLAKISSSIANLSKNSENSIEGSGEEISQEPTNSIQESLELNPEPRINLTKDYKNIFLDKNVTKEIFKESNSESRNKHETIKTNYHLCKINKLRATNSFHNHRKVDKPILISRKVKNKKYINKSVKEKIKNEIDRNPLKMDIKEKYLSAINLNNRKEKILKKSTGEKKGCLELPAFKKIKNKSLKLTFVDSSKDNNEMKQHEKNKNIDTYEIKISIPKELSVINENFLKSKNEFKNYLSVSNSIIHPEIKPNYDTPYESSDDPIYDSPPL
ncbi:hypothetical protein DMUE_3403 [Dictyocoela muelleri]|nr:hypothetical protein DMUE_3403 [Dictyocoela muelleri]